MPEETDRSLRTRERLLEAAAHVFAERGFRSATVRDIVRRAKANLNAVNYHFGDKEQLYAAVLHHADECASRERPLALGLSADLSPDARLRAFVRSLVLRMCADGRAAWHGKLMAREMLDPTSALEDLIERSFRPQFDLVVSMIRDVVGADVLLQRVRLCAMSVVGQCIHFHRARPVLSRLDPELTYGPANIEALVDHIVEFSLAALKNLPNEEKQAT